MTECSYQLKGLLVANQYLFVYGTLRKHANRPMHKVLRHHCEYASNAIMQGRLFEVSGYPGAIESISKEQKVIGELYRILHINPLFLC